MEPKTNNQIDLENPKTKDRTKNEDRMNELKEKMRILMETPMILNGDLIEHGLFAKQTEEPGSKIVQIIKRQYGIYPMLQASIKN